MPKLGTARGPMLVTGTVVPVVGVLDRAAKHINLIWSL